MWPFKSKKKKESKVSSTKEKEVKETKEKKEPIKKETESPKKESEKVSEKEETEKKRTDIYHVSRRKDDGKWQVKYGGSDKPIKLFDTQAEAIDYATELSKKYDKSITIHKKDGKIRKQKY